MNAKGYYRVNGVWIPNFLTYEGIGILSEFIAGTKKATAWKIGLLSGDSTKEDTITKKSWVEPGDLTGYARQATSVSKVIPTTLSSQPITAIEFNPVSFECTADNQAWDVSCSNLFLTVTDDGSTEYLISISSTLPSAVRLLPGASFRTAYRLCMGA